MPGCSCLGRKRKASILFLGLSNSGKTTIVHVLAKEPVEDVVPTSGFSIEKFKFMRNQLTTIDMSGALKYQSLWQHYYEYAQGIVFVVDSSAPDQLPDARKALEAVAQEPQLKGVPLLVLANKQDVPGAAGPAAVSTALGLNSMTSREFTIRGCSAIKDVGIQEGMSWLVGCVKRS